MRVSYDRDSNVLHLTDGAPAATGASLLDDPGIVIELATGAAHDSVGLIVIGASAYLPLGGMVTMPRPILWSSGQRPITPL